MYTLSEYPQSVYFKDFVQPQNMQIKKGAAESQV